MECPFVEVGCTASSIPTASRYQQHLSENTELHLQMIMDLHRRTLGYDDSKYSNHLPSSLDKLKAVNQEIEYLDDVLQHYALNQIPSLKCIKTALKTPDICLRKLGDSCSFRMSDFTQKSSSKSRWNSPPFFISGGHKLSVRVYANGFQSGTNSHISVGLVLYPNEKLQWPIPLQPNIGIRVELLQDRERFMTGPELIWIPMENSDMPKPMKKLKGLNRASSLPPWCLPPADNNESNTSSKTEDTTAILTTSEKFAPLHVIREQYAEAYNSLVFQVTLSLV